MIFSKVYFFSPAPIIQQECAIPPIDTIFLRLCELGNALGWRNIKRLPGCTEHQIDEHWWFAINPHGEGCWIGNHHQQWVPPRAIYVEYDGLPYCMVEPGGAIRGPITAGPVDQDDLLDAVEAAILDRKAKDRERTLKPKPAAPPEKEEK